MAIETEKKRIRNEFAVKQQTEYETEVSDAGATEMIIKSLGFIKTLVYEKRRKTRDDPEVWKWIRQS